MIIDNCGSFPNVPLLGIKGGINYTPILSKHWFGYPIEDKPNIIMLSGFFYLNEEDNLDLKEEIMDAWWKIHVKGKDQLGKKDCIAFKPFTQWVYGRACKLKMPYLLEKPFQPLLAPSSSIIPIEKRKSINNFWLGWSWKEIRGKKNITPQSMKIGFWKES